MHASSFHFIASSYGTTMEAWAHRVMSDGNKSTNNNPTYINQCCRYLFKPTFVQKCIVKLEALFLLLL